MKTKAILAVLTISIIFLPLMLATKPAASLSRAQSQSGKVVRSGQAEARQGTVRAHPPVRSAPRKTPPDQPLQREPEEHDEGESDTPVDPSVRLEDIRPTNAETHVKILPAAPSEKERNPNVVESPGSFTFFRNTSPASAPVVGGVTLNTYNPVEPSSAMNGRVVFYTTNNYGAISGDSGQTFSYINPFDNFPADGTNDGVNGGFGGDQYVYYDRTHGLTFWLLQYNPDNTTNTHRLAIARTQADVINNNWYYYDFTPASYGFTTPPAGASGYWMDFPDLAVSDNNLYLTTNIFLRVLPSTGNGCIRCPNIGICPAGCAATGCPKGNCSSQAAVMARIPLSQLAQGGSINFAYFSDSHFTYRLTQGAHGTMYWGAHNSTSQIRIYRFAENSNTVAWDDVNHSAYIKATMTAASPDGTDFAGTADDRILGAWVAGGVIGFMWNGAQGGGFAYPQVQVLRFNESNRSLLTQGQIFNNSYAYLYPSVQPNDRGHLGGTIAYGGGSNYPGLAAWIADDFNSGTITPLESVAVAVGTNGPTCNRWGDYFATRINVPYSNTWIGTGYVVNTTVCNGIASGGNNWEPHFVWFGRERDTPPPKNTIYVNKTNTTGYEDGTSVHPYKTVATGNFACSPGDTLIINGGHYNEAVRFSTAVTVKNQTGAAVVGKP